MSNKTKLFTFIIFFQFIGYSQSTQPGDSLIIKNNPKVKELFLKLKLPKNWNSEDVRAQDYSTLKVLSNKSITDNIYIRYDKDASYTREENISLINRREIKSFFFNYGHFGFNLPNADILGHRKLTIDTYPALMVRAKVQTNPRIGKPKIFYITYYRVFHKGLAINIFKSSLNEIDSKKDQQLLQSIIETITFPKKDTNEQLEGVVASLCSNILRALAEGKDIPNWEKTMREKNGYIGSSEDFPIYFNNFLNTNLNKCKCPTLRIATRIYPPQHIFKRLLALDLNETYEEYFYNFEDGEVNFNAYDIVDGKKETLLDWVENWIALRRGDADELRDVASSLKDEFGAKHGKDLLD